jgi:hypothetical protein
MCRKAFILFLAALATILGTQTSLAASPMSTFFESSRSNLVQADTYRRQHGREPDCAVHSPRVGGCAGLNGWVVWRSLPMTLKARWTPGRRA